MAYLGIDLGTTNSVGCIYRDLEDVSEIVRIDGTDELLPSVVSFTEDGAITGAEAKAGAIIYPETTVSSVKRLMGDTKPVNIGEFCKTPEEISAEILKKIKESAEEQAGFAFDEVVITHPAYFNDRQIFATKEAGRLAGFRDVFLLSEPLAAAIEYGYRQGLAQTLLVYDLGGGTFDACVLRVSKDADGQELFQELSDVGDMNLGGDDFDYELINLMKKNFYEQNGFDLDSLGRIEQARATQKLKAEAEQTKIRLSGANKATVSIHPLVIVDGAPKNLSFEIEREEFEALIRKYVDRSREIVVEALSRAKLTPDEVSKVIMVGGGALIPMIKRMVAGLIKEPYHATDPAKSVAMGAAIYNYLIHLPDSGVTVGQVTRQIFGTQAVVDTYSMNRELVPIIPMGSAIPCRFTDSGFASMEGARTVNVDVYQWEQGREAEKLYIGAVALTNLSGGEQLEITYAADENNLFEVYVKDLHTGHTEKAKFDRTKTAAPPARQESAVDIANIVFIIDTTGSMDSYINGVKDRALRFSDILSSTGCDFMLGLIGFGDLGEKEKPTVYKFTNDVARFQKQVKNIPRTYGGDIPESSLDALETGCKLLEQAKLEGENIFILITDAPPHVPTKSGKNISDICDMLDDYGVTMYIAARKDKDSLECYSPLIGTDGKYYDLNRDFNDILDRIAVNITELVRI